MPELRASIDIGTVTARLLVAEVAASGEISEVLRDIEICNLGLGVDETGLLEPESIDRTAVAIERFMRELRELEAKAGSPIPVMAIATSASRDAGNSDVFKARLAEAGLELEVIPGVREAALSFAGASSAFPGERVVVVDVGGGSTEVIAGRAGAEPERARSFDVGCRRVTERFLQSDPPASFELDAARNWIAGEFRDYLRELREAGLLGARMVAVAGTATSVVSIREEMLEYDSDRVHGAVATRSDVDAELARLSSMTTAEREQVTGLHPGRAHVIVAGLLILQQVMQLAAFDSFTVSERDILHGIIMAQSQ